MIIRQDTHAPFPRIPRILYKPTELAYNVRFTPSCAYDLGDEDQHDVNKLFGIGYFPSHRHDSVRFGWNYSLEKKKIQIYAYIYQNGRRSFDHIDDLEIGKTVGMVIKVTERGYGRNRMRGHSLWINGEQKYWTSAVDPFPLAYLLRPWFGGNRVAPHDIWIEMHKAQTWKY